MKILHVHTRYRQRGGEDSVVEAERRVLSQAGHDVRPVDLHNPTSPAASAALLALSPWNEKAARKVVREAKAFEPDVVHIHNTWFALSPAVVRRLDDAGHRVVATFHNYRLTCANAMLFRDGTPCELCVEGSSWSAVRYACYRDSRLASMASAATISLHNGLGTWSRYLSRGIVLTEFARQILIRAGLAPEKLVVKPNFVEDPGPRRNRPSESKEVLFVGRLSPEKGIEQLVDAWEQAAPPGLTLSVAGEGPLRSRLQLREVGQIRYLGSLAAPAVQQRMLSARALLFPSQWYEGQPMVLLEALAAGLPVLFTDVGASKETVGSGGFPWTSLQGRLDPRGLAILLKEHELDERSVGARREFEARFNESTYLEGLFALYKAAAVGSTA